MPTIDTPFKQLESLGTVHFLSRKIRGKTYGAASCVVHLFGAQAFACAVMAGKKKWICTHGSCVVWLKKHGLSKLEAELLIEAAVKSRALQEINDIVYGASLDDSTRIEEVKNELSQAKKALSEE